MARDIKTYHFDLGPMAASYIAAMVSAKPPPICSCSRTAASAVVLGERMAVLGMMQSSWPSAIGFTEWMPKAGPLHWLQSGVREMRAGSHQMPTESIHCWREPKLLLLVVVVVAVVGGAGDASVAAAAAGAVLQGAGGLVAGFFLLLASGTAAAAGAGGAVDPSAAAAPACFGAIAGLPAGAFLFLLLSFFITATAADADGGASKGTAFSAASFASAVFGAL